MGVAQLCNLTETKKFLELLAMLASGQTGKITLASFAEDPDTGAKAENIFGHFRPGPTAVAEMQKFISSHLEKPNRNFYFGGSTRKAYVGDTHKGGEADLERVLLIAADFDAKNDKNAQAWKSRLPVNPTPQLALETSPGSFQIFYLLDEPGTVESVKPVAQSLTNFCGCDPVSKDLSHVWRIPGLPNWPTKKKVQAGRSKEPFIARIANQWTA